MGEAIESVLNQTYNNWELIIVDDGSTDNCKEIIKKYFYDNRIKYIAHKENRGIPAARNTGIRAAKGEYIGFLDQDDIWLPEKLKEQVGIFNMDRHQEIGLVFSNIMYLIKDKTIKLERPSKYLANNLSKETKEEVLKKLFLDLLPLYMGSLNIYPLMRIILKILNHLMEFQNLQQNIYFEFFMKYMV